MLLWNATGPDGRIITTASDYIPDADRARCLGPHLTDQRRSQPIKSQRPVGNVIFPQKIHFLSSLSPPSPLGVADYATYTKPKSGVQW